MREPQPSALGVGDLALQWSDGQIDAIILDGDIAADTGMRTAMLLSLFCDARAEDDDVLPAGDGDRRGWWADEFSDVPDDKLGSRLWLVLDRGKRTPDIVPRLDERVRECLQWMIDDRIVDRFTVDIQTRTDGVSFSVTAHRPGREDLSVRFAHVWS